MRKAFSNASRNASHRRKLTAGTGRPGSELQRQDAYSGTHTTIFHP